MAGGGKKKVIEPQGSRRGIRSQLRGRERQRKLQGETEKTRSGGELHTSLWSLVPYDDLDDPDLDDAQVENVGDVSQIEEARSGGFVAPTVDTSSTASSQIIVTRGPRGRFQVSRQSRAEIEEAQASSKRKKKDRDQSWVITKTTPGGPITPTVIPSFGGHIAFRLWSDPTNDRGILYGYTRERQLEQARNHTFVHDNARQMVLSSGLYHLRQCMIQHLDLPLLAAFVERWQPDTNTFHMPFGEMTILLHDVYYILRIPVDGDVLSTTGDTDQFRADMCDLLGRAPEELLEPADAARAKAPLYKSGGVLSDYLLSLVKVRGQAQIEAQGYLMFLLGSTLFVDKSGDRIRAAINLFLKDVDRVGRYAWGAGTLAYLYRQLGIASRADAKGICGCLTLLQAWIYEYFPSLRPTRCEPRTLAAEEARALRWDTHGGGGISNVDRLRHYRAFLDTLAPEQVMWLPYGGNPGQRVPRSLFSGCIRFSDVIELYDPIRCLRQFGYRQVVPGSPMPAISAYRPALATSYDVSYPTVFDHLWGNLGAHSLSLDRVSELAQPMSAVADDYLQWYLTISHPLLINPTTRGRPQEGGVLPEMLAMAIVDRLAPLLELPIDQRPVGFDRHFRVVDDVRDLYAEYMTHGHRRPAPQ